MIQISKLSQCTMVCTCRGAQMDVLKGVFDIDIESQKSKWKHDNWKKQVEASLLGLD